VLFVNIVFMSIIVSTAASPGQNNMLLYVQILHVYEHRTERLPVVFVLFSSGDGKHLQPLDELRVGVALEFPVL
jgi:hypothetical protein